MILLTFLRGPNLAIVCFVCIFYLALCNGDLEPSFDDQFLGNDFMKTAEILKEVKDLDTNKTYKSLSEVKNRIHVILPGTLWCGNGNRTKDFQELGRYTKTDTCCRGHDNCNSVIVAGETKHGLRNNGWFTKSHCDCDQKFYTCLKTLGTSLSKALGVTYFDVLQPKCFKFEHPRGCIQTVRGRCVQFIFDRTKPKKYQWFDNQSFVTGNL